MHPSEINPIGNTATSRIDKFLIRHPLPHDVSLGFRRSHFQVPFCHGCYPSRHLSISLARDNTVIRVVLYNSCDRTVKTLRGTTIIESGCLDPELNIFYSKSSDGRLYTLRQPRRSDIREHKTAWKQVTPLHRQRFRRAQAPDWLYTVNQRCLRPRYRGEMPGIVPLIIEVDGEVVGFSDAYFIHGRDLSERYQVEPGDRCASFGMTTLDGLQGMGIGTYYAKTSNAMARHYNCKWILGETFVNGGLYFIRKKDDWELLGTYDGKAVHRKLL